MNIPNRLRPESAKLTKIRRQDLQQYLYDVGNMEAWSLIVQEDFNDYDWRELEALSEEYWRLRMLDIIPQK